MGFLDNVAAVQEKLAKSDFSDRVKTEWANLKNDGDSAKVIPLQELDEGSPNYNEKLGKALFALEHANPDDFTKHALCTIDEGACYGCEQEWYQKVTLYINVLFDDGKEESVRVLSRGTGKNSVGKQLLDTAGDVDFDNSISDKVFKFTRSGKGKDTSYGFSPIKKHGKKLDKYADDLFDLKEVPFRVDYEKQEAYYNGGKTKEVVEETAPATKEKVDAEW